MPNIPPLTDEVYDFDAFATECLVVAEDVEDSFRHMYNAYMDWAIDRGHRDLRSETGFARDLFGHGFQRFKGGRYQQEIWYRGVMVRRSQRAAL